MNKNNQFPTEDWSIPVPLTSEILHIAGQFAKEQPIATKAQQIYLNTIAVCAVNNYLRILGIPTNLTAGDSWNSAVRLVEDVADLWIIGKGSLECRPILSGSSTCSIPPLIGLEKIGYVMVEINQEYQQAILRGFASNKQLSGHLSVDNLNSLADLPVYLNQIRPLVNLSQWLRNIFETGWETIEILGKQPNQPALAFRSKFKTNNLQRCKLLELGHKGELIALIVTIISESKSPLLRLSSAGSKATGVPRSNINLVIELKPGSSQCYLPANLQLILLDEQQQAIIDTKTKECNPHIQLDLTAEPGEHFTIKILKGDVTFTENFIV
ncbi:MAG: DUF1822 family protein [Richelia sp. SM1_7_0]|nr:DUF1822 family protein [Richelia sp. SM1_7_0]